MSRPAGDSVQPLEIGIGIFKGMPNLPELGPSPQHADATSDPISTRLELKFATQDLGGKDPVVVCVWGPEGWKEGESAIPLHPLSFRLYTCTETAPYSGRYSEWRKCLEGQFTHPFPMQINITHLEREKIFCITVVCRNICSEQFGPFSQIKYFTLPKISELPTVQQGRGSGE